MLDALKDTESFNPVVDKRSSTEELKRIEKFSDQNLELIFNMIDKTLDNEEKRSIVVNLIGALDYYIHEIIIWGLVQITLNKFPKGKNYNKICIPIEYLKLIIENKIEFDDIEIKKKIIEDIRVNSYQKWNKIKEGLEIILPKKVLDNISNLTSGKNGIPKFQTCDLDKLVDKRHLIVHHFDRDYGNSSERNQINIDCKESFSLIENVINSIHQIILDYDSTQPNEKI